MKIVHIKRAAAAVVSLTVLLAVAEGLEVRPDFLLNRTIEELKG